MYFDGLSQTKQHAIFVRNIGPLLIFYSSSFIPSISTQSWGTDYECDKYCPVKDCSVYWPGLEFSPCVSAHMNCDCPSNDNDSKGISGIAIGFGIGILVLVVLVVCFCFIRISRHEETVNSNSTVFAQPIVANSVVTANTNTRSTRAHQTNLEDHHRALAAHQLALDHHVLALHHHDHHHHQPPPCYDAAVHITPNI